MTARISHVHYQFTCGSVLWRVREIALDEALGAPFRASFRLTADVSATVEDLLGAPATLAMERDDYSRVFRGEVTCAELQQGASRSVALVLFEPSLVRLDRAARTRWFQVSVGDLGASERIADANGVIRFMALDGERIAVLAAFDADGHGTMVSSGAGTNEPVG